MKKVLYALLVAAILLGSAACSKSPSATQTVDNLNATNPPSVINPTENEEVFETSAKAPTEPAVQLLSYTIYIPNDNADGFDLQTIYTEVISADIILSELKNQNVLPDTVSMTSFCIDNGLITIDFNQAFADVICSMGTSGELMIVGSVVNTFLDAFHAESVFFTVNGQILESGHTIYDFPLTFF